MKRLLAFWLLLIPLCGCLGQAPVMFIDSLVVGDTLYFTNNIGTTVGFFLFGNYNLRYTNSEGPGHIDFNKDGIIFADGFRAAGTGTGAFEGDGSGLTNIFGTNIVGAVLESSHATNADIAVFASNATNLWGQITTTNLPPGVLTNNWNGPTVVITNSSLVVTGAQYIALSNGAARVLLTNGTVTTSGAINASGKITGSGVNSGTSGDIEVAGANYLNLNSKAAVRSETSQQISLLGLFSSQALTNLHFALGASVSRATTPAFNIVTGVPPVLQICDGRLTNAANVTVSGFLTATTGLYYSATSNGVVSTNVIQPLHTFAALMGFVTNTINGGANTYAIVTNYSTARTNLMSCSLTAGTITNTIAGYYYCAIHMSMVALDAGALVEGDLLLNGAVRDEISFQTQFDPGTPRYKGTSAFGILYIPANSQITFQIKSSGASGIELRRQQLVVMPP